MISGKFWGFILILFLASGLAFGCGDDDDDDDSGAPSDDDVTDDDDDDSVDDDDTTPDDDDVTDDDDDDDDDTTSAFPEFETVFSANDSILPSSLESCSVYKNQRCEDGVVEICELYDAGQSDWVEDPGPMVDQMYMYDRYYDLYHQMEGQHSDVEFTQPMPAGTAEEVWSDPQYFKRYDGFGDGSGWTGTALQAAAARYWATGTEADYDRMLEKMETMAFLYKANEVPGLLMRSFFAMLEDGAPNPIGHPGKALAGYEPPGSWHFRYPLADEYLDMLPAYFRDGVNIQGTDYSVTAVWMGDASRDMYVRSLPGVMLAYDLLGQGQREDAVRETIETEIPCTLKRMKKLRIKNLQSNQLLVQALKVYLTTDRLILEQDDIDMTELDTLVGYVMEQPNPDYMGDFDATCPDELPMDVDPEYDIDASNFFDFFFKILNIGYRSSRQGKVPIAWMQFPSILGADAMYITQWALAGHYFSGDDRFLDFLEQLMDETAYWDAIDQFGSFYTPKWCKPHFAPSLLYPTMWNIQTRVDPNKSPDYWNALGGFISEEARYKELEETNDAYFGILYNNMVDATIDPAVDTYVDEMIGMLEETGQLGVADKSEPRRNYAVDLINNPQPGLVTEDLSDEDRDLCLQPLDIFGFSIDLGSLEDELPRALVGMPIPWRVPGSFQWAMDPYMLQRLYGGHAGDTQWPMQGFTVAYWTGRLEGVIEEGENQALAWHSTGESCP